MLSTVYELAENVGGEEGLALDLAGAKVVDAAQRLFTTAEVRVHSRSKQSDESNCLLNVSSFSVLSIKLLRSLLLVVCVESKL